MENSKRFFNLFDGYKKSFWIHTGFKEDHETGKVSGMATPQHKELTEEFIHGHLTGSTSQIGLIPLRSDDTVKFAVLDIDIIKDGKKVKVNIEELDEKVRDLALPLIPCLSKSGGVHLYFFAKEPIKATKVIKLLRDFASLLKIGGSEIFPKQTTRADGSDYGSGVNIPYFNSEHTTRYAYYKKKRLSLGEFLDLAEKMRMSLSQIKKFRVEGLNEDFEDAPPCLQFLEVSGVQDGARNNGAYNFAIFFKRKFPDNWREKLAKFNQDKIYPELTQSELNDVIKSASRKEYSYKCKEEPIASVCNIVECRKRKFGISASGNTTLLDIEHLTKYESVDSFRYVIQIKGKRIYVDSDSIDNQRRMKQSLREQADIVVSLIKGNDWDNKLNDLINKMTICQDPVEFTNFGKFKALVTKFFTERVGKDDREAFANDINKVYYNRDDTKKLYFKTYSLQRYLDDNKFSCSSRDTWRWLSEHMKCKKKTLRISEELTMRVNVINRIDLDENYSSQIEKPENNII